MDRALEGWLCIVSMTTLVVPMLWPTPISLAALGVWIAAQALIEGAPHGTH